MSVPTTRAGAEPAGGDRENARAAAVIENAFRRRAARARATRRHRRVVGCDPVPNARPGSSARLIAAGSTGVAPRRHDPEPVGDPERRELRLRRAHPVLLGHVEGLVRRQHLAGARPVRPAPPRGRSRPENSAVNRLTGQPAAAGAPGSPYSGASSGGFGARVGDVDGERAGLQQRVRPGVGGGGVGVEAQGGVTHGQSRVGQDCRRSGPPSAVPHLALRASPPACVSRASLRDSGSTLRRAGTSRRAEAPGAAGCWS